VWVLVFVQTYQDVTVVGEVHGDDLPVLLRQAREMVDSRYLSGATVRAIGLATDESDLPDAGRRVALEGDETGDGVISYRERPKVLRRAAERIQGNRIARKTWNIKNIGRHT
jgi:hypothetical protein